MCGEIRNPEGQMCPFSLYFRPQGGATLLSPSGENSKTAKELPAKKLLAIGVDPRLIRRQRIDTSNLTYGYPGLGGHDPPNAANQFVVHGNVQDRLLIGEPGAAGTEVGNLIEFFTRVQLQRFDLVLSYDLGTGLRIEAGEEFFQKLRFSSEFPKDPAQAIGYLDQFLRFCVNLRRLAPGSPEGGGLAGKNYHIAVVIQSADLIFPLAKQTRDYQLNSMASVVRSWSHESFFLEQNLECQE